jgi:hypothetical protein
LLKDLSDEVTGCSQMILFGKVCAGNAATFAINAANARRGYLFGKYISIDNQRVMFCQTISELVRLVIFLVNWLVRSNIGTCEAKKIPRTSTRD